MSGEHVLDAGSLSDAEIDSTAIHTTFVILRLFFVLHNHEQICMRANCWIPPGRTNACGDATTTVSARPTPTQKQIQPVASHDNCLSTRQHASLQAMADVGPVLTPTRQMTDKIKRRKAGPARCKA